MHIGTSGWYYAHWVGPFYPEGTRPDGFLPFYARQFKTVELNNTFYRLPSEAAVGRWDERTPGGFRFACKASRYITHVKRLRDGRDSTAAYFEAVAPLGAKLGPVLFQLPPNLPADTARLAAFLQALPPAHPYVFEFRHDSWLCPATRSVLADYRAALCLHDFSERRIPDWKTADFAYLRFHGPAAHYGGCYDREMLRRLARRIRRWRNEDRDVYCYFNNDAGGHAVRNALDLRDMVS